MQPSSDGYKPRYRHFHTQSTVWVQNVLDHDVVFQVADEHNRPFQYRLPQGKISELPGGAVATLGVKAIIDELIQNTPSDALRLWDEDVRTKHEEKVIVRVKDAPLRSETTQSGGIIDMSVKNDEIPAKTAPAVVEEVAFPEAKSEVSNIAQASLAKLKPAATLKAD